MTKFHELTMLEQALLTTIVNLEVEFEESNYTCCWCDVAFWAKMMKVKANVIKGILSSLNQKGLITSDGQDVFFSSECSAMLREKFE